MEWPFSVTLAVGVSTPKCISPECKAAKSSLLSFSRLIVTCLKRLAKLVLLWWISKWDSEDVREIAVRLLLLEKSLLVTSALMCIPVISQRGWNRGNRTWCCCCGRMSLFSTESSLILPVRCWFDLAFKITIHAFFFFVVWIACQKPSSALTALKWQSSFDMWLLFNKKKIKKKQPSPLCIFRFHLPAWSWHFPQRKTKWVQGQPERPQGRVDSGVRLTPRPC